MRFLCSFLILFLWNCSINNKVKYYEGYVYLNKDKPLCNAEITEKYFPENNSFTDSNGYFKLTKEESRISKFLMIKVNNAIIDSIQVIGISGGEKINYYFVEGRSDTLFIDVD